MTTTIKMHSIGVIRTGFLDRDGTPLQPCYAQSTHGTVIVDEEYSAALRDLEGFERVWLLYHLDRARPWKRIVVAALDDRPHGLFATRATSRPNPIGLSCVKLVEVRANTILVEEVDILDGTPLLDIKPYASAFDSYPASCAGWIDRVPAGHAAMGIRKTRRPA